MKRLIEVRAAREAVRKALDDSIYWEDENNDKLMRAETLLAEVDDDLTERVARLLAPAVSQTQ